MTRRIDEDGKPTMPVHFVERDGDTPDEVVEAHVPLRLPFRRGRRQKLVIRVRTATGDTTLAVETE